MALHEITLLRANGRDEIQAWLHVPAVAPRGSCRSSTGSASTPAATCM